MSLAKYGMSFLLQLTWTNGMGRICLTCIFLEYYDKIVVIRLIGKMVFELQCTQIAKN